MKEKNKTKTKHIHIQELVRHAYIYVNAHLYQDSDLDWAIHPVETLNVDNRWTFQEVTQKDKLNNKNKTFRYNALCKMRCINDQ